MKINAKKILAFSLTVAICFVAATYRFGDSAHSIGIMDARGGKVRHASTLTSGYDTYMLISTATVLPPYRGDARVVLEGMPEVDYTLSLSGPIVDLGFRDIPSLEGDILRNLKPFDRIALWVSMTPPPVDPVCGMAHEDHFARYEFEGRTYAFCSEGCLKEFQSNPAAWRDKDHVRGSYELAFYDTKTSQQVMRVPLKFIAKGEADDTAGGHHH